MGLLFFLSINSSLLPQCKLRFSWLSFICENLHDSFYFTFAINITTAITTIAATTATIATTANTIATTIFQIFLFHI